MNAKSLPIEDIDGRCNYLAVTKAARYFRAAYKPRRGAWHGFEPWAE